MKWNIGIIVAMLVVGNAFTTVADDWYVDNEASGGAKTGESWGDAFTNLGTAVTAVWGSGGNTGDTIYVRQANAAADYVEAVVIGDGYSDGTTSAYNRVVGWTDSGYKPQPILTLDTTDDNTRIITLGATGVPRYCYEFYNLTFVGTALYGHRAVTLLDVSGDIRFVGNTCTSAGFDAQTSALANDNLLIQSNTISTGYCILLQTDNNVQVLDNTIQGAGSSSIGVYCYLGGSDLLVRGNVIVAGDCIINGRFPNTVVERNRLSASYRYAYSEDQYGPGGTKIFNNIIHDCTASAAGSDGLGVDVLTPDARIFNNTFHNFPEAGAQAIRLRNYADNTTIFNNIISAVATGIADTVSGTVNAGYNDFWEVDSDYVDVVSSGNDEADDPMFVNTDANNYTIQQTSLMSSAADAFNGVDAPTNDYNGSLRPGGNVSFGAMQVAPLDTSDWFVDNEAAGNGTGTNWANAFATVNGAVSSVWGSGGNTGDTIYVRQEDGAANYSEKIVIGSGYADGVPYAYNRIVGWTDSGYKTQPIIALDTTGGNNCIITIGTTNGVGTPRNYYEICNLNLVGSANYGHRAVTLLDASSNIRFTSNVCSQAYFDAYTSHTKTNADLLIQGNTIAATGYPIMLYTDKNVHVISNTLSAVDTAIYCYLGGWDLLVRGNIIQAVNYGVSAYRFVNTTIEGNRLTTSSGNAYRDDQYSAGGLTFFNNIICDTASSVGVFLFADGAEIYNNTFHNLPVSGSKAIEVYSTSTGSTIFNNIFSGVHTGIVVTAGGTATVGYNDFWDVDGDYVGVVSLGDDKAADPMFVNPSVYDFRPRNRAVAFSAAGSFNSVNAPTNDYRGELRPVGRISFGAIQVPIPAGTMVMIR